MEKQKKSLFGPMDLTKGTCWKTILIFSLPVILSYLLQQVYSISDAAIVGQTLTAQEVAGVNDTTSLVFIFLQFAFGVSAGFCVVTSCQVGARNQAGVRRSLATQIILSAVLTVLLTALALALLNPMLAWINVTPDNAEVYRAAYTYCFIIFAGIGAQLFYNFICAFLRSMGDSLTPLLFLLFSTVLNVGLDLLFIMVFRWGVAGAAIATVASQVVSAVLCIIKLTRSDGPYRLEIKRIGFDLPLLKKITSQGVPSGVQNSIIAIANVVVQSNINTFGSDAMAGCGSYSKVEGFVFLPITAFAMALTTFIGQNLGAGQFDRAKQGARIGILCSMAMAELIGVALFFLAPYAMRLFNDDPAVVAIGVRQSHIEALFFCFLAFAHGVSAVLRGAGRAQVPMYTMLGCWCILRVSYITLALKVWPDIATIFWAYPITWSVSCVVFLIYYLKADWVHALEKSL